LKPWFLRAAAAVAALLAAVAAGVLLLDGDSFKRAIEGRVSALAGGKLRYEALSLRFFPLPHAELTGVTVQVAGVAEGSVAAVEIGLALLPLLEGKLRPSEIRLREPLLQLSVAPVAAGEPLARVREIVGPVVTTLVRESPGLALSVEGGRIEVLSAGRRIAFLTGLEGSASVSAQGIELSAQAASDLWREAKVRARVDAGSLASSANLQLSGLRLDEILNADAPADAVRLRPAPVDATLEMETDGSRRIRLASTGSAPQLTLQYGTRRSELGATRVAWEVVLDGDRLDGTVKDLQVGAVLHGASGTLRAAPGDAAIAFEFKAAMLDLAQLHAAAAALAGEGGAVAGPAEVLPAGVLRQLSLVGSWPKGSATTDIGALRGESLIESAMVSVPAAGIEVREGKGHFVLAEGILRGSGLAGKIGRSSFSDGALELELVAGRLRGLGAALQADFADALPIARRLSGPRPPVALAGIEELAGRFSGRIDYDARRKVEPLALRLAILQASGRFRGLPFPLAASRGELQLSESSLRARGLAGSAGQSLIRDFSIDLALGSRLAIRSASGEATLALEEIFPWLRSRDALPAALDDLRKISGSVRVRLAKLSGAPGRRELQFQARVEPQQVVIESPALHAPWRFTAGSAEIDPHALTLKGIAFAAGGARATVSGTIDDYFDDGRRADLSFSQGVISRKALDWIRARWQFPAGAVPRAPVAVSSARLQWPGAGSAPAAAQGRVRIGKAVDADFDLAWRPGELQVKRLAIKDADSDARVSLRLAPALADLSIDGSLDTRTLARMLPQPAAGAGPAAGAVRVEIAGQAMELSGRVEGRQNSLVVDGRVTAKKIDAERLRADVLPKSASGAAGRATLWDLPVTGRVALSAGSISYGRHMLQKVAGSVELAPRRVSVDATEATLCGIAVPFSAAITPAEVDAKAKLQARGLALEETLLCLLGKEEEFTGTLELDAELAAKGTVDAIENLARGSFRAVVRDGRIRSAGMVSHTLSAEGVAARLPSDARKLADGFAYSEINVAGTIESGRARLDPGILDSPSLGLTVRGDIALADGALDLEGLIAPIRRDARGNALAGSTFGGGSLVAIPVRIRGSFNDPKVNVLAAQAVATTLLKILGARFLLPVQLLDSSGAGAPQRPAD